MIILKHKNIWFNYKKILPKSAGAAGYNISNLVLLCDSRLETTHVSGLDDVVLKAVVARPSVFRSVPVSVNFWFALVLFVVFGAFVL